MTGIFPLGIILLTASRFGFAQYLYKPAVAWLPPGLKLTIPAKTPVTEDFAFYDPPFRARINRTHRHDAG